MKNMIVGMLHTQALQQVWKISELIASGNETEYNMHTRA